MLLALSLSCIQIQAQYVDNHLPFTCYMIRYVCTLSCFQGALTARQKIKDNKTWQIEFLSVSNSVFGIPIINKKFPQEESHAYSYIFTHMLIYMLIYLLICTYIYYSHTGRRQKRNSLVGNNIS